MATAGFTRHHGHFLPNEASRASGFKACTTPLIYSQEAYTMLNSHEHSLDYSSLESISALSTQTYFNFRWDQQRLRCALVRCGGLKSEKMLYK